MRNLWFFCFYLIVLSACSNDEPAITRVEPTIQNTGSDSTMPELERKKELTPITLEFNLPDKKITVRLEEVPILKQYLSSFSKQSTEIKNMHLTPINHPDGQSLYLLQFSCHNQQCSYLFLKQTGDSTSSYLIADLATVDKWIVSPSGNYVAFKLGRVSKTLGTIINKLVLLEINSLETISLHTNQTEMELTEFNWPIEQMHWKDNNQLTITIPDLTEPTHQNIKEWQKKDEKHTKSINLTIEK